MHCGRCQDRVYEWIMNELFMIYSTLPICYKSLLWQDQDHDHDNKQNLYLANPIYYMVHGTWYMIHGRAVMNLLQII